MLEGIEVEQTGTGKRSPEWNLLSALIKQAIQDFFTPRPQWNPDGEGNRHSHSRFHSEVREWRETRETARAFLFDPESGLGHFCGLLDMDVEVVRANLIKRAHDAGLRVAR